ncbi:MAG: aminoacyl-tRNA hydrolase [Candidatus Omnitrophota bacterium]
MKIIFGLGNPGQKYKNNRHNIGYQVIENLASVQSLEFKRSFRLSAYIAKKKYPPGWFFLIKPRTFMNNSGLCVKKVLEKYKVSRSDILIVYDDVDLPLGVIRFRVRGSTAGHRGMASIKSALGSEEINRLRVGIGGVEIEELSDYVLSDFFSSEAETLAEVIQVAVSATREWIDKGIDFTMRKYNQRGG